MINNIILGGIIVDENNNNLNNEDSGASKVGVAVIKYGTTLIIFFAILWFIIKYILPMI